jgi:hypothetical protein
LIGWQGYTDICINIYRYIKEKKTFDVFVMILCVRDWSMPVGDIQAEKMACQSFLYP